MKQIIKGLKEDITMYLNPEDYKKTLELIVPEEGEFGVIFEEDPDLEKGEHQILIK